jgi:hypothetical protein
MMVCAPLDQVVFFGGKASKAPGYVSGHGLNQGIVERTGSSRARRGLGLVYRHLTEPDHGSVDINVGNLVQSIGGFGRNAPEFAHGHGEKSIATRNDQCAQTKFLRRL